MMSSQYENLANEEIKSEELQGGEIQESDHAEPTVPPPPKAGKCAACAENKCQGDYANSDICEDKSSCTCTCQESSFSSWFKSVLSITSGVACVAAGVSVSVLTFGLGAPVGGAIMGAGTSLVTTPIAKAFSGERLQADLWTDVAVGATVGALSGGVGACVGSLAQGASTVTRIGVQMAAGATAGGVGGTVTEIARAMQDEDVSVESFAKAITVGAVCGGIGGAAGSAAGGLSSKVSSGVGQAATRIAVQTASATATDAGIQLYENGGEFEKLDWKRLTVTATSQLVVGTTSECARNQAIKTGSYKDKLNSMAINLDDLTPQEKAIISELMEKVKHLPPETIEAELQKVSKYNNLKTKIEALRTHQKKIQEIRNSVSDPQERASKVTEYLKENGLSENPKRLGRDIHKLKMEADQSKPTKIGDNNLHFLTDDRTGQIALDVPDENGNRGTRRVIADYDPDKKRFVYADYTETHDYETTRRLGENNVFDPSAEGVGKLPADYYLDREDEEEE